MNLDLIYGLPHQRPDNFRRTVEKIIAMQPDRVALFSYAHVPWLKKHQAALDEAALPDARTKFTLFHDARSLFLAAGYVQVGMDHFARPGDELAEARRERRVHRNFMGYTVLPADDLIGFGITAISDVAGRFAQNEAHLAQYYRTLDAGRLPAVKGIALDDDDKLRAHVISTLMCNFELRFAEVEARFGLDFAATFAVELAELAPLAADGLIEIIGRTPCARPTPDACSSATSACRSTPGCAAVAPPPPGTVRGSAARSEGGDGGRWRP